MIKSQSTTKQYGSFEEKLSTLFKVNLIHNRQINSVVANQLIELLHEELMIIPDIHKSNPLSLREMICLLLLASGKNTLHCADLMNVSAESIRAYIKRINKKLHVNNRTQAFFKALQIGCFEIIPPIGTF